MSDNISLIITAIVTAGGATWAIRSKLSDLEKALGVHTAETTAELKALSSRVTRLERVA